MLLPLSTSTTHWKNPGVLGRRRCQPVDLFYATAASKFSVVTFQLESPRVVSRSRGHAWLPSLPATVVWPIETVPCALTCSSHSFLSHQAHQLTSLFPRNCQVGFRSFHLCVSHTCGGLGYRKTLACAFVKLEATKWHCCVSFHLLIFSLNDIQYRHLAIVSVLSDSSDSTRTSPRPRHLIFLHLVSGCKTLRALFLFVLHKIDRITWDNVSWQ